MAVASGTEAYVMKSQSPCPSGIPDCQLVLYKMDTRPVYTQKQKIFTMLHWACCQGHGGHNCEDTVPDPQPDSGSSTLSRGSDPGFDPETQELRAPASQPGKPPTSKRLSAQVRRRSPSPPFCSQRTGSQQRRRSDVHARIPQQRGEPNREQNDYQASISTLHDSSYPASKHNATHATHSPDHSHSVHHTLHHAGKTLDRQQQQQQQQHHHPGGDQVDATDDVLPHAETPAVLPIPHMMALVMSQLQPVLEVFNRSLEHLSQQVGDLASDVAQLKSSQQEAQLQPGSVDEPELDEAAEQRLDAKLDEVFQHIREVRKQMVQQWTDMESRLHSQHAMLHYNVTSLKTEIDMKLKRHQKILQVSLQAMNATLLELKLDQDQSPEDHHQDHLPAPQPLPASDTSALWEAIERLDNMVVNNTVKVSGLMEDMEVTSGNIQHLKNDLEMLEEQIKETARRSQVLFMETGLEVEDAKVTVLQRVNELAGNLSQHSERLQEMDVDVDYLYTVLYKNNSTGDCNCKALKATVAHLERAVVNVTELANENRLALDETSEGGGEPWDRSSDWMPEVEVLQLSLQHVKESLALEQSRIRTLEHALIQLSSTVTTGLSEVSGLKETDRKVMEEMQHLSGSFSSLLKDAIRHSDVLELLLGEEVLEFLEWPIQDQEAHSIPAVKEQLRQHNLSITLLLGSRPGGRDEVPSADQPSSFSHHLLPDGTRRSGGGAPARERQLLLHPEPRRPEHRGDGSDLWNLEKMVEELGLKLVRLEKKPCPCSNISTDRQAPSGGVDDKLRAEVVWLKRGLEEHLRVFKNVFSNADVLAEAEATLELDKLWELVKNTDKKKKKKGGGGRDGRGGDRRSRRDSSGVAPVSAGLSDSLLFVAGSPQKVSGSGVVFEASLNRGHFHPDTGSFKAPADGFYLFILTLDLRPGPVHMVLRRGSGGGLVSLYQQKVTEAGPLTGLGLLLLRQGEEARVELREGAWVESEDNVFTGLLLHQTT